MQLRSLRRLYMWPLAAVAFSSAYMLRSMEVGMELWSEYRDDIHESHEVGSCLVAADQHHIT